MASERLTQKEATRARILEVARSHFERDGFEAASIRAIAEEAKVAAGTVLLHFTDKVGLLHTALHDDLEVAIEKTLRAARSGSLLDRLSAVARSFFSYYETRPQLSKVLLREALLAEPPWRERFAEQAQRVIGYVAELVTQARDSGELDARAQPALVATAFASFYYFALIAWVQDGVAAPLALFTPLMAQHLAPYASPSAPRRRKS